MWVIFYLKISDNVTYMTSDMQNYSIMQYKKFKQYILSFKQYDGIKLLEAINSFDTILLDTETREWNVVPPDYSDVTDEQLMVLNRNKMVIKNTIKDKVKREDPKDSLYHRTRNSFKIIYDTIRGKNGD